MRQFPAQAMGCAFVGVLSNSLGLLPLLQSVVVLLAAKVEVEQGLEVLEHRRRRGFCYLGLVVAHSPACLTLVFLRLDKLLERVLEIGGRHPLVPVLPFPRALLWQSSCGSSPEEPLPEAPGALGIQLLLKPPALGALLLEELLQALALLSHGALRPLSELQTPLQAP